MAYDPTGEEDSHKLISYMENAKYRDPTGYQKACRRLCSLEGRDADDPLEREMDACIAALEQFHRETG